MMSVELYNFTRILHKSQSRAKKLKNVWKKHLAVILLSASTYFISFLEGPVSVKESKFYVAMAAIVLGVTSIITLFAVYEFKKNTTSKSNKGGKKIVRSGKEASKEAKKARKAMKRRMLLGMVIITGGPRIPFLISKIIELVSGEPHLKGIEWVTTIQGLLVFIWCYKTFNYRSVWSKGKFPCCCAPLCCKNTSAESTDDTMTEETSTTNSSNYSRASAQDYSIGASSVVALEKDEVEEAESVSSPLVRALSKLIESKSGDSLVATPSSSPLAEVNQVHIAIDVNDKQ